MKISFIVPVYNVEAYLRECIESIINQTYDNIEIIAVNDGSTDGSLKILHEYSQKDIRISVISQKNKGLSEARNTGLKHVTGDYILFVDSDDYIATDTAQIIYEAATYANTNIPVDIISFSRCSFTNQQSEYEILSSDDSITLRTGKELFINQITEGYLRGSVSNKSYRTSFIFENKMEFIPNIRYEDLSFTVKSLLSAKNTISIKNTLYYYRRSNSSSITNTIRDKDLDVLVTLGALKDFLYHSDNSLIENSDAWRAYMCKWICNATFFKYPTLNFWSKTGWKNCRKIKNNSLFRSYLKRTAETSRSYNLRLAARLIDLNIALFYIVRKLSKVLFPNKQF